MTEPLLIAGMRRHPSGEVRHIPGDGAGMGGTSTAGFLREYDEAVNRPNLGLATTRELLDELRARIESDGYNGGGGLDYTTVGGKPESHPQLTQ